MTKTNTNKYKDWLKLVGKEYDLTMKEILGRKHNDYIVQARHTFYWLCFRDKIDMYRLSEALGKTRTTVWTSMRNEKHRSKEIENKLWNYAKASGFEGRIRTSN